MKTFKQVLKENQDFEKKHPRDHSGSSHGGEFTKKSCRYDDTSLGPKSI